ncbi:MAG: hypothetical protein IAX21_00630 [Candidatus Bathyarchaeota archaeon]|nr:MAG: hypothetical protein IAX21_00630 [Candidatus Bathyarchaeota archaeon]
MPSCPEFSESEKIVLAFVSDETVTQNVTKKVGVTGYKTPSVIDVFCRECPDSEIHQTGSLLWVSCKFQSGWRSINSVCNFPNQKNKEKKI